FRFDGDNWVQEAKLLPGDAPPGDSSSHPGFGYNVAIDGETIAVAAQGKDELGVDSGSVYVFVRDGAVWNQQAKLLPSDGATWEYFGQSIAIHGDDIVVGTWGGGSSPIHAGSAYVFVRSGTTWTQQVKLVAPDAAAGDHFGVSVDIDGDTVVAGAYADERG
ncbi:MAG: FG-GAP repeat protein, partial [Phycisphaerales bacterium]